LRETDSLAAVEAGALVYLKVNATAGAGTFNPVSLPTEVAHSFAFNHLIV
jgi:hypothetical protein